MIRTGNQVNDTIPRLIPRHISFRLGGCVAERECPTVSRGEFARRFAIGYKTIFRPGLAIVVRQSCVETVPPSASLATNTSGGKSASSEPIRNRPGSTRKGRPLHERGRRSGSGDLQSLRAASPEQDCEGDPTGTRRSCGCVDVGARLLSRSSRPRLLAR